MRHLLRLGLTACVLLLGVLAPVGCAAVAQAPDPRPNILWITCEDISPNLGCYGDAYAVTPNLDRLAARGVRYTNAFATIGVCAPARSTIITGMYPPSIGTQHMRCQGTLPEGVEALIPSTSASAGYYCTNNSKTDYNFDVPEDDLGRVEQPGPLAEPRARASRSSRSSTSPRTHESQIRLNPAAYRQRTADFTDEERHDPAKAPVPPYHPDTPEVRARLGPLRRHHHLHGQAGRRDPRPAGRGRPGRQHDRLLLLRPRCRHAAQQALALRLQHPRPVHRPLPGEVPRPGARRARHDRPTG